MTFADGDSGSSEMLNPATTTSEPEESDKETTTEVSTHSLLISTTAQCLTDTEMGEQTRTHAC